MLVRPKRLALALSSICLAGLVWLVQPSLVAAAAPQLPSSRASPFVRRTGERMLS
jgi:hypothetical protein